jgi:hypothetical protein
MGRLDRSRRAAGLLLWLALAFAAGATTARAEMRAARAIGAVPAPGPATPALRDAAQRAALREAVLQAALGLLPPDADAVAARPAVESALGADPLEYATRYRVLQDRGIGPRAVLTDPGVAREYAMEVEAQVDLARVRAKLAPTGLVRAPKPAAEETAGPIELVLEGVPSVAAYSAVRTALVEKLGARSALPRELEPGRAVIRVSGGPAAASLVSELAAVLPPELGLEPTGGSEGTVRARFVLRTPPPPAAPQAEAPAPPAAD